MCTPGSLRPYPALLAIISSVLKKISVAVEAAGYRGVSQRRCNHYPRIFGMHLPCNRQLYHKGMAQGACTLNLWLVKRGSMEGLIRCTWKCEALSVWGLLGILSGMGWAQCSTAVWGICWYVSNLLGDKITISYLLSIFFPCFPFTWSMTLSLLFKWLFKSGHLRFACFMSFASKKLGVASSNSTHPFGIKVWSL